MGSGLVFFLLAALIYICWKNIFVFYVNQILQWDTLYFLDLI